MSGTRAGGLKAAAKNIEKDPSFYQKIGAKGGANGTTGGFAARTACDCGLVPGNHITAQCRGTIGGMTSRRWKKPVEDDYVLDEALMAEITHGE